MILNRFARLSQEFSARYPDVAEAQDFQEQLRDYLRKTAPARLKELM
jgi:hypothetical protein